MGVGVHVGRVVVTLDTTCYTLMFYTPSAEKDMNGTLLFYVSDYCFFFPTYELQIMQQGNNIKVTY